MNLSMMKEGASAPKPFTQFASDIIKSEGVSALYAGLSAGCLRQVFYATSRYGLFETFRDTLAQYRKTDFAQRFATASVAGGCAALISCPVEVCLVRLSNDASLPTEQRRNYKGVFNALTRIMTEEGPAAFYRGSQPFVMRAMLVGGTQVATYDQFKGLYAMLGETFSQPTRSPCITRIVVFPPGGGAYVFRTCITRILPPHPRGANGPCQPILLLHVCRAHLLPHHHALRDGEESDGVSEIRPGHGQASVHGNDADDWRHRALVGAVEPLDRVSALLQPLRRPHRVYVHRG